MLQCFIDSMLAEDNVAVLGVDLLAHPLPGGLELGDIGVVTDVDGAMGAAQQGLSLQALNRGLCVDAFQTSGRIKLSLNHCF